MRKKDTLCFVQNEELVKLTEVIAREICYTGVIHIDARLHDTSDKIFLIEANPRFWGSLAEATSGGPELRPGWDLRLYGFGESRPCYDF